MRDVVIDLFAGPGGWDLAAEALGVDPVGIELDDGACATRDAAGLRTIKADVSALRPQDFAPCWGLIASPPCQAFSVAGAGRGRAALGAYWDAIVAISHGEPPARAALDAVCADERAHLVLEPLRWALALEPQWIACEQVVPVLPLWDAMAHTLAHAGYWTWAGVLSAEQYGVPQTRRRAILLASREHRVLRPRQTHQTYIAPRHRFEPTLRLFDPGPPQRIVAPEEVGLLPWVSMAEALRWPAGAIDVGLSLPGGATFGTTRRGDEPAQTLAFGKGPNDTRWLARNGASQEST